MSGFPPLSGMRGLVRPDQQDSLLPVVNPGWTQREIAPSQAVRPLSMEVPMPSMREPVAPAKDEFATLTDRALSLAKEFAKPEEREPGYASLMRDLQTQLDDLKRAREAGDKEAIAKATRDPNPDWADADEATGDYMVRNASFESGNNPKARHPGSGASGLFQFLPSTWAGIMKERPDLGLTTEGIFDVDQQKKAMAYFTRQNALAIAPILGRKPTGGELYLAHLLGAAGASQVLKGLDAPITATISPAAYTSNPFLKKYKTGIDLIAGLNQKFGGA